MSDPLPKPNNDGAATKDDGNDHTKNHRDPWHSSFVSHPKQHRNNKNRRVSARANRLKILRESLSKTLALQRRLHASVVGKDTAAAYKPCRTWNRTTKSHPVRKLSYLKRSSYVRRSNDDDDDDESPSRKSVSVINLCDDDDDNEAATAGEPSIHTTSMDEDDKKPEAKDDTKPEAKDDTKPEAKETENPEAKKDTDSMSIAKATASDKGWDEIVKTIQARTQALRDARATTCKNSNKAPVFGLNFKTRHERECDASEEPDPKKQKTEETTDSKKKTESDGLFVDCMEEDKRDEGQSTKSPLVDNQTEEPVEEEKVSNTATSTGDQDSPTEVPAKKTESIYQWDGVFRVVQDARPLIGTHDDHKEDTIPPSEAPEDSNRTVTMDDTVLESVDDSRDKALVEITDTFSVDCVIGDATNSKLSRDKDTSPVLDIGGSKAKLPDPTDTARTREAEETVLADCAAGDASNRELSQDKDSYTVLDANNQELLQDKDSDPVLDEVGLKANLPDPNESGCTKKAEDTVLPDCAADTATDQEPLQDKHSAPKPVWDKNGSKASLPDPNETACLYEVGTSLKDICPSAEHMTVDHPHQNDDDLVGVPEELASESGDRAVVVPTSLVTHKFTHAEELIPVEVVEKVVPVEIDALVVAGHANQVEDLSTGSFDENENPLLAVSAGKLVLLALPLVFLAQIAFLLQLEYVPNWILKGTFRSFTQLHLLGWILSPIFKYGSKRPIFVSMYSVFMIVLATYEASSRLKYSLENQFSIVFLSLLLSVGWVALWAFGVVLKPQPFWNPRYVLPIVGMLLGNSIHGISITLDLINTSLVEKQSEIDLFLSFGATQFEAVSDIVKHAIHKGITPTINMMCVVGIISIPGMMTGQILGGSNPMVAARYQVMTIFLAAMTALSTILISSYWTIVSVFDAHQISRPERLVKNRARSVTRFAMWMWSIMFGANDKVPVDTNVLSMGNHGQCIRTPAYVERTLIRSGEKGELHSDSRLCLLEGDGLSKYIALSNMKDEISPGTDWDCFVLFENEYFEIHDRDVVVISGPSGIGKTQFLKSLAGLNPLSSGELRLEGKRWEEEYIGKHATEWRKQVRYLSQSNFSQSKVLLTGTPRMFIRKILSFDAWRRSNANIKETAIEYVREWGIDIASLDKEWSVLSGGESQRILLAIALASRPKILLLDEPSSALDQTSKLAVENSVAEFVQNYGSVVRVSHDGQQDKRVKQLLA